MKAFKSFLYYLAIIFVIIALFSEGVEARRKILRGRKTITRTYYRSAGVPAWAIVLLSGLGMILVGVAMYFVMNKTILEPATRATYSVPPLQMEA